MLLSIKGKSGKELIAKAKFNHYLSVSNAVLEEVEKNPKAEPVLYSMGSDDALPIHPVGLHLKNNVSFEDHIFSVKSSELSELPAEPEVTGVYFPLVAVIIPQWLEVISQSLSHPESRRILFLVSGYATPWNKGHAPQDNSTEAAGKLMKKFINKYFPQIEVVHVHSGPEIFRYDSRVRFVNEQLKPQIEHLRRELAEKYGEKWSEYLHVTLSLSGGVPAQVSAISAALREFRPDLLHMWQLKTFWHEFPDKTSLEDKDVEYHQFDKLETTPSIPVEDLDSDTRALVDEMIGHKDKFMEIRDGQTYHELDKFWLRKSKQPVLAVIAVDKPNNGGKKYFRGMNVEVSMPTGSLCAERNAIGTALAADFSLTRRDLKMVAVLSLGLTPGANASSNYTHPPASPTANGKDKKLVWQNSQSSKKDHINPIAPCGACKEWLKKIAEVNPDFKVVTFTDPSCTEVFIKSVGS